MRLTLDALSGCNIRQINKINNIVMVAYNRLATAETQTKQPMPLVSRAVKGVDTDLVNLIKGKYYNSTVTMEFVLNTKSFEPDKTYILALLNYELKSLTGNGADSRISPKTLLSNYGNFIVEGNVVKFDCSLKPESELYYVSLMGSVQ